MPDNANEDAGKDEQVPLPNDAATQAPAAGETKKWPSSVYLPLPFFAVAVPLYESAKKYVNWRAVFLMVLTFSVIAFVSGHYSVLSKHWIWNPNRTLGPTIWAVPIEEPLLYYWFPPVFCVVLMHAIEHYLGGKRK
jgi:lycopene cyclase domain-containing protein